MSAAQTAALLEIPNASALKRTPLHALHVARGGKLVPFAGYDMPVQYATGVLKEHLHTRKAAGLFDVSHMGQILVRAKSGIPADAARALERLMPQDILALAPGRQRYAQLTNAKGGILDDLMVANLGDRLFLVVNAANKAADAAHLRTSLSDDCEIDELPDRALIALQGPLAATVLAQLAPTTVAMRFMDAGEHMVAGISCLVSRSGYTGEDGFEISVPANDAERLAGTILDNSDVWPIGVGARDSLRLEAGLCLHGQDIDSTITPVEAGLVWSIQKARRAAGARPGGFPGSDIVLAQLGQGPPRRRVGLRATGRAPVRAGALLYATADAGVSIGAVTSGGFSPSIDAPVAMGYVTAPALGGTQLAHAEISVPIEVFAEVRGQRLPMRISPMPFVPHSYLR